MASMRRDATSALAILGTATWTDDDARDEALSQTFGSQADALLAFAYLAAFTMQVLAHERDEHVVATMAHIQSLLDREP